MTNNRIYWHLDLLQLDFMQIQKEEEYFLYGVVVHKGTSLKNGHYVCNILSEGVWYEYNDHHVKKISKSTLLEQEAYILFYRKKNE